MIFRHNGLGLGAALSLASVCLTFSAPALAQDDAEAPASEAAFESTLGGGDDAEAKAAPEAPDDPAAAESEEDSAEEPEAEPAKEPAKQAKTASPPEQKPAPSTAATASDTSVEREKTVSLVGLEQLPASGYPSAQIRGIKYGSLWRTFHGQQWPYMPEIAGEPSVRIAISGGLWNDLSNTHISVDKSLAGANVNDQNRWTTQTRGVLRLTPTYNAGGGWFAQGNAEVVVQGDMRVDPGTGVLTNTDDVWVRAGKWDVFDITVGRFQGWEIANHYGMALDLHSLERYGAWIVSSSLKKPTDGYGLTYFWDRQNFMLGAYALHVYPTKYLRGEVLGHVGAGNSANAANPYQVDVRPSLIFDVGFLKLKGGLEYGKAIPQDSKQKVRESKNGYGFAAQVVLDPYVEFGGNFARGFQDVVDNEEQVDLAASNTVQTVGGFLNASPGYEPLVFGFGAYLNHWEDLRVDENVGPHQGKVDTNDQWLVFGSVQYNLWTRLYLKFVVSHASNKVEDFQSGKYINNALSGRFRTEFLF